MSAFEEVERPAGSRAHTVQMEVQALLATETSGKALRVPLDGHTHQQVGAVWTNRLWNHAYIHLRLRTKRIVGYLLVWVEPRS